MLRVASRRLRALSSRSPSLAAAAAATVSRNPISAGADESQQLRSVTQFSSMIPHQFLIPSRVTRTCKVLHGVISKVRRPAMLVNLQDDISFTWGWLRLDGSPRRLCTSQEENKHVPYSGKALAQTKKEQCWRYDPTIKYEALRRYAVPSYAYNSSDWSDSSDCEVENVYMAGKEAQTAEKEKICDVANVEQVVGAEEEQLFIYDPSIKYKPLSRYIVPKFAFSDTSSTDWSESTDSESEIEAMAEEATEIQKEEIRSEQLFFDDLAKSPSTDFQSVAENLTESSLASLQYKSAVQDLSFLVKQGVKSPTEGGAKDLKRAGDMDLYTGLEKVTNEPV